MKFPWPRFFFAGLICFTAQSVLQAQTNQDPTVDSAIKVLDEIMSVPAKQIPQALLANAAGVAIIPNVVKGGFVVGLRHGRGVILIRDETGQWQPPIFASLTGGSVGWQAGLQSTDVVLVFKTRQSVNGLMNGKLTIGADAAAAAGPVGRQAAAATDERLGAEILSYSRSRGLFAGVSIDGSALQLDHVAGADYYHRPIFGANGEVLAPLETLPDSAIRLMNRLARYTGSPEIVPANSISGPTVNGTTSLALPAEAIKRELASAWEQLSMRLDERWKAYLAPPSSIFVPGADFDVEGVRETLRRYSVVGKDQRFAVLQGTPEFAAVYQKLQEYASAQAPSEGQKLTLPPPPKNDAFPAYSR